MKLTQSQLNEYCRCGHTRARHYGYTGQDGMCDRCYCPNFNRPRDATFEAETKLGLLDTTLEMTFNAMRKA